MYTGLVVSIANLSYPVTDFSNFLKNAHVERLAEADQSELVKDIKVLICGVSNVLTY